MPSNSRERLQQQAKRALVGITAAILAGCTTFIGVPLAGNGTPSDVVRLGDDVRITTRTGEILEFEVSGLQDDAFVGPEQRIAHEEVETVEVRRFNKRALYLTLGAIGAALLIIKEQNDSCTQTIFGCEEDVFF